MSLCLIAYIILLLVTLHPACRPAVYSVLVTLPLTLLLVCSLVLSTHQRFDPFTLLTSQFSDTLPVTSLFYSFCVNLLSTLLLFLFNHFLCIFLQIQVIAVYCAPQDASGGEQHARLTALVRCTRTCAATFYSSQISVWIQEEIQYSIFAMYKTQCLSEPTHAPLPSVKYTAFVSVSC